MTPSAGVEVRRHDQALQQHFAKPDQALGPQQGQVVIGDPLLAPGAGPLGIHPVGGNPVKLGVQRHAVALDSEGLQATQPLPALVPAFLTAGGDQLIGHEQRPFRFDVFEFGQFFRFVVQPAAVFDRTLVAIAEKPLVAVLPSQFTADATGRALAEIGLVHTPGRVAHDGETGAVGFLAR